jgi:hypothetical protein
MKCPQHKCDAVTSFEESVFGIMIHVLKCPLGCIYTSIDELHWVPVITVNGEEVETTKQK